MQPPLLDCLHTFQHPHRAWWKFFLLKTEVLLPCTAHWTAKGAALDKVVYEPQGVEAVSAFQLCAFVLRFHSIENESAGSRVVAQRKRALVDRCKAQWANLVIFSATV